MTFEIKPARRENTTVMICLNGESGSGKTLSAILLAAGMCGKDEKPLVIDTEARKALHYAERTDPNFRHLPLDPPFTPERFAEAVTTGVNAGFKTIVIDSFSDVWEGIGGMLEIRDAINAKGPGGWKVPKQRHHKMINVFRHAGASLIFCVRADKERIQIERDGGGKTIVSKRSWVPVAEKRFGYDMVISLMLRPDAAGVVDLSLPHRLPDDFRTMLVHGRHIDQQAGELIGAWARGSTDADPDVKLWRDARNAAHDGRDSLRAFASALPEEERSKLRPIAEELNATARRSDAEPF